ncbi:purine-binding chemotaxis protein CheW [Hathewaya proteolytica DSM 3090]|uniref:Purine-binding chemotaxis protein CheW n=1 Tax=Hathewaya proteolytica DSM 3090 TaxID=1121331 RepID=A0A1M6LCS9_9CLOT|nr:chemotaxis protein CheW [Hathewaya proteolytica]SHJ68997.1 purine-binding chemotaxis protein CheW [Hathewaya proteolytica DSM 3090]
MENKEIKVLIFMLKNEYYALDIMQIERILAYEETTKIPEMPSFVDGVKDYEGRILPIINLAKKFNIDSCDVTKESKVIVTRCDGKHMGIVVDEVSEVINVHEKDIEKNANVTNGISKKYVNGLIKLKGNIIISLDTKYILSEFDKEQMDI